MNYNNIPKKVLNMVVAEAYEPAEITLKDELDKYEQDIIAHRYNICTGSDNKPYIEWFHGWTKDYTLVLVDGVLGGSYILGVKRNPPDELLRKVTNETKR